MPPSRILGPIEDFCRDRTRCVDQLLQNKGHLASQNNVCHENHAHRHYSTDCRLPLGRGKEAIANLKSLSMSKQKRVS